MIVSHDKAICGVPSIQGTFSHMDMSQQSFPLQPLLRMLQKRPWSLGQGHVKVKDLEIRDFAALIQRISAFATILYSLGSVLRVK